MVQYRILNPNVEEDRINYFNLVDDYKNSESMLYPKHHIIENAERLKSRFVEIPKEDYVVSGKFENGTLTKFFICYKLESPYTRKNLLPYWVFGLIYGKDKSWSKVNHYDLDHLSLLACNHFENLGYTKAFIFTRAPSKIFTCQNINEYLNTDFIKTYTTTRGMYYLQLEHLFRTQEDLDNFNFSLLKGITSKEILKPFMIVSWNLKPEYMKIPKNK